MSNTVEPIRDTKKIAIIKSALKSKKHPRDYLLFVCGINFALRISDLLNLKARSVVDNQYNIKPYFVIKEQKTKKTHKVTINQAAKDALNFYLEKLDYPELDLFLFKSHRSSKPLDSVQAWRLMKKWCHEAGIKEICGTHTLRKTWGYHARKKGIPIELIQAKYGHSSPAITRRYIGITSDEISDIENLISL